MTAHPAGNLAVTTEGGHVCLDLSGDDAVCGADSEAQDQAGRPTAERPLVGTPTRPMTTSRASSSGLFRLSDRRDPSLSGNGERQVGRFPWTRRSAYSRESGLTEAVQVRELLTELFQ